MAKIFQVEMQVITDDDGTSERVEKLLTKVLKPLDITDGIFVREVNFAGNIEDDLEDDDEN